MSDRALTVLVHGPSKAGKTTFANTAPYPRLLLDVESASRFLAVLERAGVISQGRGRLTVHDPAALRGYVY